MILPEKTYTEIISKIKKHKGNFREFETKLSTEYGIPKNTISSIISNEYKRKMKKSQHKSSHFNQKLIERYHVMKNVSKDPKIMLKLAEQMDTSSILIAKAILEKYCDQDGNLDSSVKKSLAVKQYLKDSTLIQQQDLAYEVFLCQLHDYQHGNINDIIRHCFGQEYECHLRKILTEKNLTFQTEEDLRINGYDKTPDIKLDVPFAIDGFVVNWIESKALFGDLEEHGNYIKEQYSSYWNRFGTGLVIYWLGMVDSVIDPSEKRFIVRHDFPENITLMDPFIIAKIPKSVHSKDASGGGSEG